MTDRTPEAWFHDRATHYVEAQLLHHLGTAGVIGLLATDGPLTTDAIAERLGLVRDVLETLLTYVEGVDELLVRDAGGAWRLTDFGSAVVERYGRVTEDGLRINLFDVRVGCYGPVWAGAGALLDGSATYGDEVVRRGDVSARALYTICQRMAPAVRAAADASGARFAVEFGVTTGLLEGLPSSLARVGLDRSAAAIAEAAARPAASGVTWLEADLFDADAWLPSLPEGPGLLYSVHFHEILAAGEDRVTALLKTLRERLPGWSILALEQPLPRPGLPRVERLYAWSNVLIHHLVGNGRILDDAGWRALFEGAGWSIASADPIGYLGYVAYRGV